MTVSFSGLLGLGSAKYMAGARVPNDTMVGKESTMENGGILQHFRGFYHDCYRLNIRSQKASKAPGIYNFLSTAWTPDMEDTMSVKGVTQSAGALVETLYEVASIYLFFY